MGNNLTNYHMHKNNKFTTVLAVFAFLVLGASIIPAATNAAGSPTFSNFSTLFGHLFAPSAAKSKIQVISGVVTDTSELDDQDVITVQGNGDANDGAFATFQVQLASLVGVPNDIGSDRAHVISGAALSIGVDASNIRYANGQLAYQSGAANGLIAVGDAVTMQGTIKQGNDGPDFSTFQATSLSDKTLISNFVHTGKVVSFGLANKTVPSFQTTGPIGMVTAGGIGYYVILGPGAGSGGLLSLTELDNTGVSVGVPVGGVTVAGNVTIPYTAISGGDTITIVGPVYSGNGLFLTHIPGFLGTPIHLDPLLIIDQNPASVKAAQQIGVGRSNQFH